jgi:GNAT superfamily N-acetyltransferase
MELDLRIEKIALPVAGIELLHAEAIKEGYAFLETLLSEWESGENRYNRPGETLLGCFEQDELVAVGGLNVDPFLGLPEVGRVRRVYVRAAWRNRGVGRLLVNALVEEARGSFRLVRLRAENADAARLYERLGFEAIQDENATHQMALKTDPATEERNLP